MWAEIGLFIVGGKYDNDRKEICRNLTDHYASICSRRSIENMEDELFNLFNENAITDDKVIENYMIIAIDRLRGNSAPGLGEISAILKNTQRIIAKSMMLMLRQCR